jgi:hypothetical protein
MEIRIFVGRDSELRRVDRLIRDNKDDRRMAIVHAAEDMGKTALLDEIWDRYHTDTAVVFVDVGQEYELPSFVYDIADQLAGRGVISAYPSPADQPGIVQLTGVKARNSPINIAIDNTVSSRQEADRLLRKMLIEIDIDVFSVAGNPANVM